MVLRDPKNICRLVIGLLLCVSSFAQELPFLANETSNFQSLQKRVLDPPLPTTAEVKEHMIDLGLNNYVFYQSVACLAAATWYAQKNGKGVLGNTDDGSEWVTLENGPFQQYNLRRLEDLPTWTDDEEWQAIDIVSVAYAEEAKGIVTVILPYGVTNPRSHWNSELAALKVNPAVTKIVAYDMHSCNNDPQGDPRELWPTEEPMTECAG